jgi:hypothetical protein
VADFDGDGEAELGSANDINYVVFDPDCVVEPDRMRDGECATGRFDGVLWQMRTNDHAGGTRSSSAFDFDRDGTIEVVYADECFQRIYDGATGHTRFIVPNPSGGGFEYPTVADLDGDDRAEIVVAAGLVPFCPDLGADVETGEPYVESERGVRIFEDDAWPAARPVWNQHAYSATNVEDDGGIPAAPANNWESAGHNDFHATSGPPLVRGVDLTVRGEGCEDLRQGGIELTAVVANRGTKRAPSYVWVTFYGDGPPEAGGLPVCETRTALPLDAGATESVNCVWADPDAAPHQLWIRVDPRDGIAECEEPNNDASMPDLECSGIG